MQQTEDEIEALKAQLTKVTKTTSLLTGVSNQTKMDITQLKEENAQLKDENAQLKIENKALIDDNRAAMKCFNHLFYSFLSSSYPNLFPLSIPSLHILTFLLF